MKSTGITSVHAACAGPHLTPSRQISLHNTTASSADYSSPTPPMMNRLAGLASSRHARTRNRRARRRAAAVLVV